jgi:hypothetical protein
LPESSVTAYLSMMPERKKNILMPEQLSFLVLVLSETEYEKI